MARLPTWDTLKQTFRHFVGHLGLFETAAWPWLALLAAWNAVSIGLDLPARYPVVVALAEPGWQWVSDIAVAVAWHRAILLDEPATGRPRLGRAEFRYLGIGLALGCFILAPLLPALLAAAAGVASPTVRSLLALGAIVAAVVAVLAVRSYLALPGAAIGSAVDLGESWRRTRGNGWRLLGGLIASALPATAIIVAWDTLIGAVTQPGDLIRALAELVSAGLGLAGTTLVAGFLSFSYLWFDRSERGP